ncbi:hypothetical protein ACVCAH_13305 [Micromonospora sp. LZ34]
MAGGDGNDARVTFYLMKGNCKIGPDGDAYSRDGRVLAQNTAAHTLPGSARIGGGKLGFFEQARADKYRRELEGLRQEINDLTVLMHKRTQSRRVCCIARVQGSRQA